MKRAALLLAALSLALPASALADVRAWTRLERQAAADGGGGLELAQRDRRDDRQNDPRNDPQTDARPRISPQQAEAAVNRVSPGRALNIEAVTRDGRPYWQVRWQTKDGRRVDYLVDGISGVIAGGG